MNNAVLTSDSSKDLQMLLELAKEQQEELGLYRAIKEGRTKEFVDTDKFLKK